MKSVAKNQNGFSIVEILLVLVLISVLGGATYYVGSRNKTDKTDTTASTAGEKADTNSAPDPYEGWQTFSSDKAGFSIKYPSDWQKDASAYVPQLGGDETYDFVSPDGLRVRYAYLGANTDDRADCGHGSACSDDNVISVDSLSVPDHGKVLFVKREPKSYETCYEMSLHEPMAAATTPHVGNNSFSDYEIFYSLSSKNSSRFLLLVTDSKASEPTFDCKGLTEKQFFATKSVQQAELVLKSITYKG